MTDVYLDFNATAPVRPQAATAIARALEIGGNASSVHRRGRMARRTVEDAREQVAGLVGGVPGHVVLTSGGTEANNLVLRGLGRRQVIISAVEHDSVLSARSDPKIITVDRRGIVDVAALDEMLFTVDTPTVVSIMLANNETGVIQPIAELAEVARRHGALFHTDAVQAAGKLPINAAELGVDFLTLSGHKVGGPQGVGALVVLNDTELLPQLRGGGQERSRRAGTENIPGIAGFGAAAEIAANEASNQSHLTKLRDGLEDRITAIAPGARVYGEDAQRIGNTSCMGMPGVDAETQVMALDLAGVMVSAGAACSSGTVQNSHVLAAMGIETAEAKCAIRVSLGWSTVAEDVDKFVDAWLEIFGRLTGQTANAA